MHPIIDFLSPYIYDLIERLLAILLPLTLSATGIIARTILTIVTLKLLHAIYQYFYPPPPPRIPDHLLRFPSAFNPPIPLFVNDNLPRDYWKTYLVRKAAAKRPGKITTLEGLYEEQKEKLDLAEGMLKAANDEKKKNDDYTNSKQQAVNVYGHNYWDLQPRKEWEKEQKRLRGGRMKEEF